MIHRKQNNMRMFLIFIFIFSLLGCNNDSGVGFDPDDVTYDSSIFTITKGEDFVSDPLNLSEVASGVKVRIKDVKNFNTKESEKLFFDNCEIVTWTSPVDLSTDKSVDRLLAKYNPVKVPTLSIDEDTGVITLYGTGSANIPAAVYLVDLEFTYKGESYVKESACRFQIRDNSNSVIDASVSWKRSGFSENVISNTTSREIIDDELNDFKTLLGNKYNSDYSYLILKVKDRRRHFLSWKDRLVSRGSDFYTFDEVNPWIDVIYTDEAVIIPCPVPFYPVVENTGTVYYKIDGKNVSLNSDIYLDIDLSLNRKGVFEITTTLADSDSQGKLVVIPGGKKIYFPFTDGIASMDHYSETAAWSYHRMAASDNIVVFWEEGFADDPSQTPSMNGATMSFDLYDLLEKGEQFFAYYKDVMKFIKDGESRTDSLRMLVRVLYTPDWVATGSGYDDMIGALWVNPSTMQPIGQTIAHEFGHSFQYQVYCDGKWGYRGMDLNGNYNQEADKTVGFFWEACAEFMAFQQYPSGFLGSIPTFIHNCHKGFAHEWVRYQAFLFSFEYWKQLHGIDFCGRMWTEAQFPDDPIQTYQKLTGKSQEAFNDEYWTAVSKNITWDIPLGNHLRTGLDNLSSTDRWNWYTHKTVMLEDEQKEGYYRVQSDTTTKDHGTGLIGLCPHDYGYNAIQLEVPASGTTVMVDFEGLINDSRYKNLGENRWGWRYGFVGVGENWTAFYSDMGKDNTGQLSFTIPSNLKELWLVVTGAPTEHKKHFWDDDASNDEEYPYRVKFTGTDIIKW